MRDGRGRTARLLASILGATALLFVSCAQRGGDAGSADPATATREAGLPSTGTGSSGEAIVTFVELGSVNCIPCMKMQVVMKEIEAEYADQVRVVFHDVWTEGGKPFAATYRIRVIPTQVFLDAKGREYFRHEGYFPKAQLVEILKRGGVR